MIDERSIMHPLLSIRFLDAGCRSMRSMLDGNIPASSDRALLAVTTVLCHLPKPLYKKTSQRYVRLEVEYPIIDLSRH